MTNPNEISNIIRKQIEDYSTDLNIDIIGTVLQVGDGIARVYGLDEVMAGELLEFDEGTIGIALNLENDNVGAVLMGDGRDDGLLGRVLDPLAIPIDGKGDAQVSESRLIESMAPGIITFTNWYYCH